MGTWVGPSEIRFSSLRNRRVDPGVIFADVLGAAHFPQFAFGALVSHKRLPWHGEGAGIIDRQFELQTGTFEIPVEQDSVWIGSWPTTIARIMLCGRCFGGLLINQPVSL